MIENIGTTPEGQVSMQPAKPVMKPVKPEKKKKESDGIPLPLFVEFIFTFSVILMSVVFLVTAIISLLTGATLLDFVIRTGGAVIVQGIILLIISRQVSRWALRASKEELDEELQKESQEESLVEPEVAENDENTSIIEAQ